MSKVDFERLSNISKALSHPERSQIVELLSADHCNVTEIVRKTGISQPKVSGHLSNLQSVGMVESVRSGKEIIYSIVPETLENLSAWIDSLAGRKSKENYTEHEDHYLVQTDFSFARCCYDHLAGKMGVWLLKELLRRSWLKVENSEKPTYKITDAGIEGLHNIGVKIPLEKKNGRMFAYGCRDVSERKLHLGGSLGYAIFKDLVSKGILTKSEGTRILTVNSPVKEW
ncbi:MAG: metalloregulator ArsR/SmtB family transcription factor, partial [Candidatus Thermoplasmatota archaeon]|nr:metalloregulator ArsR/SmtB family transcription factor [Candidatus Thermoplasmatota archaeon]